MPQKRRLIDRFVILLLMIGTYYYTYRYPLKINDAQISASGYAATPLWLALGKYLLVALVLLYIVLVKILTHGRVKRPKALADVAYFYLGFIPILYGLLQGELIDIESGVFWIIALWLNLWFFNERLQMSRIANFIYWAIYISIAADFIQIALYFLTGRLPALAYAGSINIRFGSILDDPNGFGLLLSLFFGFAIIYYTNLQRIVVIACLLLMLLATQSLTALAAVVLAAVVYGLCYLYHRPSRFVLHTLFAVPIFLLMIMAMLFNFGLITETLSHFFRDKAGSIAQHTESINQIFVLDLPTLLGLTPQGHVGESGYINYLANYGIFYLLVYAVLGIVALYRYYFIAFRTKADLQTKAVASGIFMYLVAVMLANVNLPLREIFPHNLYIPLFLGLVSSHIMRNSVSFTQTQSVVRHTSIPNPIIVATNAS